MRAKISAADMIQQPGFIQTSLDASATRWNAQLLPSRSSLTSFDPVSGHYDLTRVRSLSAEGPVQRAERVAFARILDRPPEKVLLGD